MSKQKNLIEASQNVTFDTDGNVGIGTSSPNSSAKLDVRGDVLNGNATTSNTTFGVADSTSNYYTISARGDVTVKASSATTGGQAMSGGRLYLKAGDSYNGQEGHIYLQAGKNLVNDTKAKILFNQGGSETARFDASGNLLVGTTNSTPGVGDTDAGISFRGVNGTFISRNTTSSSPALYVNRSGGVDGPIQSFMFGGSTIGNMVSFGGNSIAIAGNSGTGIGFISSAMVPTNSGGNGADNQRDVGSATLRWDDIRATNATIQTSDQNEKQQIASLTTAEMDAAKAISQLFKTFKWNSAVTAKGDAARTHAGVIAQEVETAMTNAGLDAGDYAFFISDTWWETQTDVPAVAAVAEVLDDDGNVVTEAVEAQDAYTRTDTYETLADAPAGATERTRKGIRYPELLAFVGAATEQRLADIETRLTALEAV